jgi:hypothetical protein
LDGDQPAFGLLLGGAAVATDPGGHEGDRWLGQDGLGRQALQPAGHRHLPAAPPVGQPMARDQRPRLPELSGCGGVVDGLLDVAGRPMPGRGPLMQHPDEVGVAVGQLQA